MVVLEVTRQVWLGDVVCVVDCLVAEPLDGGDAGGGEAGGGAGGGDAGGGDAGGGGVSGLSKR